MSYKYDRPFQLDTEHQGSMFSMGLILISVTVLIASILIYHFFHISAYILCRSCTCKEKPPTFIRDLSQATSILKSSTLLSRAPPNQRLVRVFFISNAFTTTNEAFYRTFLLDTKSLLKTSDEYFLALTEETRSIAERTSSTVCINDSIHLNSLVQVFCFRFVLLRFFPNIDLAHFSTASILRMTQLINSLWLSSKCSCFTDFAQILMQYSLQRKVALLFTPRSGDKDDNPLNILLPAYETLWRVVLRCFLEVAFIRSCEKTVEWGKTLGEWEETLSEYVANPTSKQFTERSGARCSVQDIVFESLRLYPPTKRIYRQDLETGELLAVDVEYLQRSEEVWGVDRHEFWPSRWRTLEEGTDNTYKEAWMPFGKGSFQCPALKVAPMMIGMLVGSLVRQFVRDEWVLEGKDNEIPRGEPLDNGREACGELSLRRVHELEADG